MNQIIESLAKEHSNVRRLLDTFDRTLVRGADSERDFGRLRDIMQYMVCHIDGYHHKIEELIEVQLITRHPTVDSAVKELSDEHRTLAVAGDELLDALRLITPSAEIVGPLGQAYSETLRRHLDSEEATMFPISEAVMTAEDWVAVNTGTLPVCEWADDTVIYLVTANHENGVRLRSSLRTRFRDVRLYENADALLQEPLEKTSACLVIDLPDGEGITLLNELNACGLTLPSLIVVEDDDVDSAVRAISAGAADCLQKPIVQRALLGRIENVISTQQQSADIDRTLY